MESTRKSPSIEASTEPLYLAVAGCLARHARPGERLLVGLSGGIDSVVLLHALSQLAAYRLAAVHVNHHLSQFAGQWEAHCREYCHSLGIPINCVDVVVERNSRDGLEAAARRVRHQVFATMDTDWVMLAHHRDDQAETLMFNLLRGTGVAGAAGMREKNGRLLRPLLSIGREEVVAYAQRHRLQWCDDESNEDVRHSRNFLRNCIFPELKKRFPQATANIAQAATRFAEAKELLDALACIDLADAGHTFPLSVDALAALGETRGRNVLRYLLSARHVQIPSESRLRETLRQMIEAGMDRHPSVMFGRHRLYRRRGWIYLESAADEPESN